MCCHCCEFNRPIWHWHTAIATLLMPIRDWCVTIATLVVGLYGMLRSLYWWVHLVLTCYCCCNGGAHIALPLLYWWWCLFGTDVQPLLHWWRNPLGLVYLCCCMHINDVAIWHWCSAITALMTEAFGVGVLPLLHDDDIHLGLMCGHPCTDTGTC